MIRPFVRACVVFAFAGAGLALSPGVAVAASSSPGDIVISTTVVTNTGGETLTTIHEKTYNSRGNLVGDSEITTNAANHIVVSDVTTATYGGDGRYLSSTRSYDGDGDGVLPSSITVSTASYDKTGFLIRIVTTVDDDSDGSIDSTDTQTFGKDRKNRTSTTTLTLDGPFGVVVQTLEATFDARGNLILAVSSTDYVDPTATDFRFTSTSTYLNRQLVASHDVSETLNPTGPPVVPTVQDTTLTYDSHGNLVLTITTQDSDGVAGVDATYTATQTYDSKGRVVHAENLSEATGQPTFLYVSDFTYDASGRVVAASFQVMEDGVLRSRDFVTETYDSKGRLLSNMTTSDDDGDGANDRTTTSTSTYDGKGRLATTLSENRDGSGALTSSVRQTFTYTKTTMTTTTLSDVDGDGVVDQTVVTTTPL